MIAIAPSQRNGATVQYLLVAQVCYANPPSGPTSLDSVTVYSFYTGGRSPSILLFHWIAHVLPKRQRGGDPHAVRARSENLVGLVKAPTYSQ